MSDRRISVTRRWAVVLLVLGVAAVAVAVGADLLRGGPERSFGARQALLAVGGAVSLVAGGLLWLLAPRIAAYLDREAGKSHEVSGSVEVIGLAVWFGLLAGLPELLNAGFRSLLHNPVLGLVTHAVWLAPVPNVAVFLFVGLAVIGFGKIWPALISYRGLFAVFGFVLFFTALLLFEADLHILAILFLALGLAWRAASLGELFAPVVRGLARRSTLPLALLWLAVGGVSLIRPALAERSAYARSPAANAGDLNVLLIILDTVRAQNLSLHSYDRPTSPNLDDLAGQGVVFEKAFSTAPWTLPSHASLFTGLYPHDLRGDWAEPLGPGELTLAEFLRDRGYATVAFVGNRSYAARGSGLERGFSRYDADVVSVTEALGSSPLSRYLSELPAVRSMVGSHETLGRKRASQVTGELLDWLDDRPDRPFFAFLNYFDAHDPYLPRSPFSERFDSNPSDCTPDDLSADRLTSVAAMAACLDAYDAAIAQLDAEIGFLFEELERRNLLEETLVVVTSDHGEEFGEHGVSTHGRSLYRPSVHVPLVFVAKGLPGAVPSGARVEQPASLRDVPATIVDLLGLASPFPGRSLARMWSVGRGTEDPIDPDLGWIASETSSRAFMEAHNPVSRGHMLSLIARGKRFIHNGDGVVELYDMVDSREETNLAEHGSEEDLRWFSEAVQPLKEKYARNH